jgi:hypothetical protein
MFLLYDTSKIFDKLLYFVHVEGMVMFVVLFLFFIIGHFYSYLYFLLGIFKFGIRFL